MTIPTAYPGAYDNLVPGENGSQRDNPSLATILNALQQVLGLAGQYNFDSAGAANTAQSNAETFATSAVGAETARAEAAEALLVPLAQLASSIQFGITKLQPTPNVSSAPTAAGTNIPPQTFSANGPFPLSAAIPASAVGNMFNQILTPGIAANATIQGSPRDCSNTDYLYQYRCLFVGSAAATLVVQSSPNMITWTTETSTAAAQIGATGVWVSSFVGQADQAYYHYVLNNGAAAQSSSTRILDGTEILVAA